jgi:hypothetical protein
MRLAIVCAAMLLSSIGTGDAHVNKAKVGPGTAAAACHSPPGSGSKNKSNKALDCRSTGTLATSKPFGRAGSWPEPRLGYRGSPWSISGY